MYFDTYKDSSISPDFLINMYCQGYFPMADSDDGAIGLHCPDPRAIFDVKTIVPPRSLRQFANKHNFTYSVNQHFEQVIRNCANRESTWISDVIIKSYTELHYLGIAHSVEVYSNGQLCGGLYGVALGAAFFGESMFSTLSNAAKAAFYYLMDRLVANRFILLDSQYINDFTEKLGAYEISQLEYLKLLKKAIAIQTKFQ